MEVANYGDIIQERKGLLSKEEVRRVTIRGIVDSGAAMLVLPATTAKQLGSPVKGKVKVRYADGRRALRNEVEGVHVTLAGTDNVFSAVVEPKRQTALIGAIVLEALDLLVDCNKQRLVPRDPDFVVSEIE
jgi:predicted aspartyl protease